MTTIGSSIRSREFQHDGYSDDELRAMKKDGDTSGIMDAVRREAGIGGRNVDQE